MRRLMTFVPILLVGLCLVTPFAFGQQKLAQTGMKFLNVAVDARAASLGEAFTAVDANAASMFFNPAGMARSTDLANVSLGQVKWIAEIKHNYVAVSISPWQGEYGVLGLMVQTVDYGELQGTIRSGNTAGYIDMGTFNPKATMFGVGYARALSDKFAVGGAIKWVHQNLGDGIIQVFQSGDYLTRNDEVSVFAFDFGMTYKTGYKSLQFGVVVRNFSKEARYIDEGFQLPLTFKVGVSMNVLDFVTVDKEMHQFLLSIDAEHPRDYPERLRMGGEYTFMQILSLRAGFVSLADEQKFSYGVGLQKALGPVGLGVDYAYTPFGVFDNVHTFALKFSF
jgi:hypothetical protein